MSDLNEMLVFARAPQSVRTAFRGQTARRHLFVVGTELFKFTQHDLIPGQTGGTGSLGTPVSPWWCAVNPLPGTDDTGFDGLLAAARAAGVSAAIYAREVLAVMFQWNSLSAPQLGLAKVLRIRLTKPVFGFFGRAQRQANDQVPLFKNPERSTKPTFAGEAYQIWIPNLTSEYFVEVATHLLP